MSRRIDAGLRSFRGNLVLQERERIRARRLRRAMRAAQARSLLIESLESRVVMATGVTSGFGLTPLSFEPNVGQTDSSVDFLARGNGYSLFLTQSEAVVTLQKSSESGSDSTDLPLASQDNPSTV